MNCKRYFLYIEEHDGEVLQNTCYAQRDFDDVEIAIKEFRKLVREDLLKKWSIVKCSIRRCQNDKVFEFTEQRITPQQNTISFLRRK
jgi:hypothetical protein